MEDNDGSLWLATNNGIVHVTGNMEQPNHYIAKTTVWRTNCYRSILPFVFYWIKSGRIWVGTEGSGLCLYNVQDDCFESVHQAYNLPEIW